MGLHAVEESVHLQRANEIWLKHSKAQFPQYESLEAYVSFFAFFSEVHGRAAKEA
jgi:hypothetical protein